MSFFLSFFQKLLAMEAKKDNEDSAPYSTAGLYIIWRYAMLQSFSSKSPWQRKPNTVPLPQPQVVDYI